MKQSNMRMGLVLGFLCLSSSGVANGADVGAQHELDRPSHKYSPETGEEIFHSQFVYMKEVTFDEYAPLTITLSFERKGSSTPEAIWITYSTIDQARRVKGFLSELKTPMVVITKGDGYRPNKVVLKHRSADFEVNLADIANGNLTLTEVEKRLSSL